MPKRAGMQKVEFINVVAQRTGLAPRETRLIIETAIDLIADSLARGEKVILTGFGTFEVRERQARTGVDPRSREKIQIAATRTPGFSASQALKQAIRGGEGPDGA